MSKDIVASLKNFQMKIPTNPDQAARWLIMSAYLYYERNCNVLSDGDYDKLSNFVADHWSELTPQLQWQLGSAEDVRATGSHILITQQGESAAITWFRNNFKHYPEGKDVSSWEGPHEVYKCLFHKISG